MRIIRGKRALITGAASGIGRALALRLAKEGADVCLLDIDHEGLEEAEAEAARFPVRTLSLRCDVSQPEQISEVVAELLDEWDGIEILVNNVGVVHYGATELMTAEQWDRILSINLHAPIHFTRLLLPTLLRQKDAHLVNISSMYGYFATRKAAAYHASKYALLGLTESLRAEFGPQGIGVTAVCPGFVKTNLYESGTTSQEDQQVPSPPAWACTTPERVAERTIRAIYRKQRLVLVTPLAYGMYYLTRFAPWLLDFFQQCRNGRLAPVKNQESAPGAAGQSVPSPHVLTNLPQDTNA